MCQMASLKRTDRDPNGTRTETRIHRRSRRRPDRRFVNDQRAPSRRYRGTKFHRKKNSLMEVPPPPAGPASVFLEIPFAPSGFAERNGTRKTSRLNGDSRAIDKRTDARSPTQVPDLCRPFQAFRRDLKSAKERPLEEMEKRIQRTERGVCPTENERSEQSPVRRGRPCQRRSPTRAKRRR